MKKDNLSMKLSHRAMGKADDLMVLRIKQYELFFLSRPNCALLTMMKDQFANYVVQKVSCLFASG